MVLTSATYVKSLTPARSVSSFQEEQGIITLPDTATIYIVMTGTIMIGDG
jgi:hypothetical protein